MTFGEKNAPSRRLSAWWLPSPSSLTVAQDIIATVKGHGRWADRDFFGGRSEIGLELATLLATGRGRCCWSHVAPTSSMTRPRPCGPQGPRLYTCANSMPTDLASHAPLGRVDRPPSMARSVPRCWRSASWATRRRRGEGFLGTRRPSCTRTSSPRSVCLTVAGQHHAVGGLRIDRGVLVGGGGSGWRRANYVYGSAKARAGPAFNSGPRRRPARHGGYICWSCGPGS